jgi:GxxExxY protein
MIQRFECSRSSAARFSGSDSGDARFSGARFSGAHSSGAHSSDTPSSTAGLGGAQRATHRDERGSELLAKLQRQLGVTERVLYAELSHAIVGAAIEVHRHLGPGKLESTYQSALDEELSLRGIPHRGQVPIALRYKGRDVGSFVLDFIVDDKVVLELKAVERQHAVHKAQVLSYLHATKLRLGLLINFNVPVLWKGVQRVVL